MTIRADLAWGIIPARGGSKSIPLKNLAPLGGRPLIDYVAQAGLACAELARVICSTDSPEIADHARDLGLEAVARPSRLAGDETPVVEVLLDFLQTAPRDGAVPEYVALLQPTSPFIKPDHIARCLDTLRANRSAGSAQTIVPCPHNHHATNQRLFDNGTVRFRYAEERRLAYNKQRKVPHWLFGNVVVVRTAALREQGQVFAEPSLGVLLESVYGFDADGRDDFRLGEAMLSAGMIDLPHLATASHAP